MKRFLAGLALAIFSSGLVLAQETQPLRAGVAKTWTVDMAREEAFKNARPWVDVSQFPGIDPNLIENKMAVERGGGKEGNRVITVFDSGTYSVQSANDALRGYYYSASGELEFVEFLSVYDRYNIYPFKTYRYIASDADSSRGLLVRIGIQVGPSDSFNFMPTGKLLSHWINSKCYSPDGSSCGTRMTFKD